MGNSISNHTLEQYISNFIVDKRDQQHNLTYLIEKRTRKQYLLKEVYLTSKDEVRELETDLSRRKSMVHQHLTSLIQFYVSDGDGLCTQIYKAGILFEFPFRTLQDEKVERIRMKTPFKEQELWSIAASGILGMSYLQKNFISHRSLRASTLQLDTEGILKISDPKILELESNFSMHLSPLSNLLTGIYLSPIQYQQKAFKSSRQSINLYKSDVFVLGVIVLELALLQTQQNIYSRSKSSINQDVLKKKLALVQQQYGQKLKGLLTLMVETREPFRMDFIQLENFMKKTKLKDKNKYFRKSSLRQEKNEISAYQNLKQKILNNNLHKSVHFKQKEQSINQPSLFSKTGFQFTQRVQEIHEHQFFQTQHNFMKKPISYRSLGQFTKPIRKKEPISIAGQRSRKNSDMMQMPKPKIQQFQLLEQTLQLNNMFSFKKISPKQSLINNQAKSGLKRNINNKHIIDPLIQG